MMMYIFSSKPDGRALIACFKLHPLVYTGYDREIEYSGDGVFFNQLIEIMKEWPIEESREDLQKKWYVLITV